MSPLGKGYQFTDPATAGAIADEFRRAAVPLGPLFKAIPERAPEVAVLESYASAILSGKAPWDWKMKWFSYGELAQVANLAPCTIYEVPSSRLILPSSAKKSAAAMGSSWAVGSSSTSTPGCIAMTEARLRSCF